MAVDFCFRAVDSNYLLKSKQITVNVILLSVLLRLFMQPQVQINV